MGDQSVALRKATCSQAARCSQAAEVDAQIDQYEAIKLVQLTPEYAAVCKAGRPSCETTDT